MSDTETTTEPKSWWARQKASLDTLFAEYGTIAIITYFTIFFGTWFAFWWAIGQGIEVAGATGEAGRIGGAYAATKLTQPVRIGVTVVATPIIAALWHRFGPTKAESPSD